MRWWNNSSKRSCRKLTPLRGRKLSEPRRWVRLQIYRILLMGLTQKAWIITSRIKLQWPDKKRQIMQTNNRSISNSKLRIWYTCCHTIRSKSNNKCSRSRPTKTCQFWRTSFQIRRKRPLIIFTNSMQIFKTSLTISPPKMMGPSVVFRISNLRDMWVTWRSRWLPSNKKHLQINALRPQVEIRGSKNRILRAHWPAPWLCSRIALKFPRTDLQRKGLNRKDSSRTHSSSKILKIFT